MRFNLASLYAFADTQTDAFVIVRRPSLLCRGRAAKVASFSTPAHPLHRAVDGHSFNGRITVLAVIFIYFIEARLPEAIGGARWIDFAEGFHRPPKPVIPWWPKSGAANNVLE